MTRRLYRCIQIVLAVVLVWGCTAEKKSVRITVQTNDTSLHLIKINRYDVLNTAPSVLAEAAIDSAGAGVCTFALAQPGFVYYEAGEHRGALYVSPGYDLTLHITVGGDRVVRSFSGEGAEANMYVAGADSIHRRYDHDGVIFSLPTAAFAARIDSIERDQAAYQHAYFGASDLPDSVLTLLAANVRFRTLYLAQGHLLTHTGTDTARAPLERMIADVPLQAGLLRYGMVNYAMVLQMYLDLSYYRPLVSAQSVSQDTLKRMSAIIDRQLSASKLPAGITEFMLAENIDYQMSFIGYTPMIDSLYKLYKTRYPGSSYQPVLQVAVDKWLALSPGRPAPEFTAVTAAGDSFSLSGLRGKVVYMDVWATWCGPCREEFPASKALQKVFAGNDSVVFLYASVDRDTVAWRKMVAEGQPPRGLHINRKDELLWNLYLIRGVPRYILIDTNGNMVLSDAPRPSSGKAETAIRAALQIGRQGSGG